MSSLAEIDALEILAIVDNEVDPVSTYQPSNLKVSGRFPHIAARAPIDDPERPGAKVEARMDNICCGAHGLSLMLTAIKGDKRHTLLFDTGPEEMVWELNAKRLNADIATIETIHLSHWHRDHSGGMLKAVKMINDARAQAQSGAQAPVVVDLHPNRPKFRGIQGPQSIISLEADPTFEEIEAAGGKVAKNDAVHTILDDMFLISGKIPRVTPYETGLRYGMAFNPDAKKWEKDELILDERFVMCNVAGKGVVVFTGCSHGGAINASKNALGLAGGSAPLYTVVGGYHLVGPNEPQIQETIEDFRKLDPAILMPGHCSGWRARVEIEKVLPGRLAPLTVGTHFTL